MRGGGTLDVCRFCAPRVCSNVYKSHDDDTTPDKPPPPPLFSPPHGCYEMETRCNASSFASVRSSVMMPPAVSRGTASSPSRSPADDADDGSCGASPRLFSTSARASQSTLPRRPCLWYSQSISDSSEPSGTSSARRTKPRESTYAFSL